MKFNYVARVLIGSATALIATAAMASANPVSATASSSTKTAVDKPAKLLTDAEIVEAVAVTINASQNLRDYAELAGFTEAQKQEIQDVLGERDPKFVRMPTVRINGTQLLIPLHGRESIRIKFETKPKARIVIDGQVVMLEGKSYGNFVAEMERILSGSKSNAATTSSMPSNMAVMLFQSTEAKAHANEAAPQSLGAIAKDLANKVICGRSDNPDECRINNIPGALHDWRENDSFRNFKCSNDGLPSELAMPEGKAEAKLSLEWDSTKKLKSAQYRNSGNSKRCQYQVSENGETLSLVIRTDRRDNCSGLIPGDSIYSMGPPFRMIRRCCEDEKANPGAGCKTKFDNLIAPKGTGGAGNSSGRGTGAPN